MKIKSKIISYVVVLAMALSMFSLTSLITPTTAQAATQSINYVALGDSVPAGYGLDPGNESYVEMFSRVLNDPSMGRMPNDLTNLAVSGLNSTTQLAGLNSLSGNDLKTLQGADLITLNIGGNDLQQPLLGVIKERTTIDLLDPASTTGPGIYTMLTTVVPYRFDNADKAKLQAGVDTFKSNFPKIISWLNKNAPNAIIIVNTVYNPFYKSKVILTDAYKSMLSAPTNELPLGISEDAEIYTQALNKVIKDQYVPGKYEIADVHALFNDRVDTGVNLLNMNLNTNYPLVVDTHPDAGGHGLLYGLTNQTFEKAIAVSFPTAANIKYGQKLSASALKGGSNNGTFSWSKPNTIPAAGKASYEVTFKPKNTAIFSYDKAWDSATKTIKSKVSVDVAKATLSSKNSKEFKISVKNPGYTGKNLKGKLTIKHNGKTLVNGKDYTAKYSKSKNIGKATITVTGKGNFTGKATITYKIVPKKTSISKLSVGKKQITVSWKKVSKVQKITNYKVRYKIKGQSSWKTKTVPASKKSLTIKGLKKGKVYQVQVAASKKIKSGSSKGTYVSDWSKSKTSKKVK